jgi:hypothetical protein
VPVLLSVGYSTCHWCHVMEEESFEDLEIARYLNENYVAIKVDREERPDVDAVYMAAVNAITGRGGWPMTVWLTPDREPFHGGTYFPARDGDRGARVGLLTLLQRLKEAHDTQPDRIATASAELTTHLRAALAVDASGDLPDTSTLQQAASRKGKEREHQPPPKPTAPPPPALPAPSRSAETPPAQPENVASPWPRPAAGAHLPARRARPTRFRLPPHPHPPAVARGQTAPATRAP